MPFSGDDRGQSVVIGAVILFGFLVIALSTYQATVVPQQNSQVEFDHEQTVRDDFVGVRDAVVTAGTTGETVPASVKLGTRFPGRTLFINPPPAVGRIETGEPRNVTLNVSGATFTANPPESDEVRDGWPTVAGERFGPNGAANYTTKPLVYTPQYRSYDGGPDNVTLELSHVVSQYPDGQRVDLTEAPLLARGDRVTLFLLKGNLSEVGVESLTLEPSAVSSVSQRVRVSGFTVTVPTSLTASQFERRVDETQLSDPANVSFSDNGSRVDVTFEDNRSLAIGVVSVGRHDEPRTASAVEFTAVEETVTSGESARVVVRARDQYGNALANAGVTANMTNNGRDDKRLVTDGTGQAAFEFNTSGVNGVARVNVTVNRSGFDVGEQLTSDTFEQSTAENATANVTVESVDSPSDGPTGNQTGAWPLAWDSPADLSANSGVRLVDCSNESCTVDAWNVSELETQVGTGGETNGATVTFATNNSTIAAPATTTTTTDANGNATTTVSLKQNGAATLVASSGGGSDTLELRIVNNSIRYERDAAAIDTGGVRFGVTNLGSADRVVTDIRVTPLGDGVARLDDPSSLEGELRSEFYVDAGGDTYTTDFGGGKAVPTTFDLSEARNANDEHRIESGETAEYTLYQFRDSDDNPIDMTGRQVEVELFFADGGRSEFVLDPEAPSASIQYNDDATVVGDDPGNSDKSGVAFSIDNTGSTTLTVTEIKIDPANPNIARLDEANAGSGKFNREFFVEVGGRTYETDFGGGQPVPSTFDLSEGGNADDEHVIGPGETARYTLYRFLQSNGNPANMKDEELTLTLTFADGTTQTFTITPN
jgi:hypothetical protein